MRKKTLLITGILIMEALAVVYSIEPMVVNSNAGTELVCDTETNLSHSELSSAVSTYCAKSTSSALADNTKFDTLLSTLNTSTNKLITGITYENVYCQKDYEALRLGTSTKIGTITFTFSKAVSKIGLYMSAWNGTNESKKCLVNGAEQTLVVGNYATDYENDDIRYVIDLGTATDTLTISAKVKSNNRICIYSMGFYI